MEAWQAFCHKEVIMAGINWERDFNSAIEKAKNAGKPVFHDFWFEG